MRQGNRSRLRPFFGCNDMELIMAEHRRTAHSRKAATRKTASKNTRKTTVRKASSARRKSSPKKEGVAKALVAASNAGKRRARSETRRLQANQREENRSIAQALGGTKFTPQDGRLSLRALDADLLYQPRRQDLAENARRPIAARQDRTEAAVSSRRIDRHTRESGYPVIADLHEGRTVTEYWIIRFRG